MEYIDTVSELNYLTQIVIMLYEDSSEEEDSERRFHVELHFSPGAYGCSDVVHPVSEIHGVNASLPRQASLSFDRSILSVPISTTFERFCPRAIERPRTARRDIALK